MSFKHIDFLDSQIMREFEKKAIEKGLIKPEEKVIVKEAASQKDYTASGDFTSNIIKLCARLHDSGFSNYANELESKFLIMKKAQVEQQTFIKNAEKVESDSVIENTKIIIAKLRSKGLIAEAKKLESQLYDLEGDGEDLIHQAHPNGGTKLTSDKESRVETILEQREEMNKVLKTSSQIINEVKKALGQ